MSPILRIPDSIKMLLKLAPLDLPTTAEQLFGRAGPLVLEVGFGDGQFTAGLARRHPEWNIIGAEVSLASVTRAVKRMRREGVTNVRLHRGHGRFIVRNLVAPGGLHQVFVNFPDPWPRQRHHKNRLLQADFFQLLATRLEPDGALQLTTDHEEYFQFALAEGKASGCFAITQGPPPPPTLETKYAKKWRAEARPIYHAVFTRTGEAGAYPPLIEKVPMHHALMEGDLGEVRSFKKQTRNYGRGHVILLDAYRTLSGERLVFQVLINEQGDLQQEVLIEARAAERGVQVGLLHFGDPLTTRGTREAVRTTVEWLETQGFKLLEQWF